MRQWIGQTSGFLKHRKAVIEKCFLIAILKVGMRDFFATDVALLLDHYGYNVGIVQGEATNIKISYQEDMVLAEAIGKILGYG